jgi:hypothetical protein
MKFKRLGEGEFGHRSGPLKTIGHAKPEIYGHVSRKPTMVKMNENVS